MNFVPMIVERELGSEKSYDIFSRLLKDRIVFITGEIDDTLANNVIAELLYLDSINNNDINIYINSPGGSVIDALAVIDTINLIKCNVSTTCIGMAASMGAVLLSCGEKDKRFVLPHSRVMIHQVSSGMKGVLKDMEIELEQTKRCKNDIYHILASNMGKSFEEVELLCDRNNWFIGQEAVDLGIADKVLIK